MFLDGTVDIQRYEALKYKPRLSLAYQNKLLDSNYILKENLSKEQRKNLFKLEDSLGLFDFDNFGSFNGGKYDCIKVHFIARLSPLTLMKVTSITLFLNNSIKFNSSSTYMTLT